MAPEIFSDFLRYSDSFHKVKDQECLAREAHYIQSIATADRWNTDFLLQKSSAFPMGILQEFLNYFSLVAFRDQEFLAREAHYLQSLATADRWNTDYFYLVKVICFSDRNSWRILEGFHCKGIKNFWLVRHITSNPLPLLVVEINISFATESIRRSHLLLFQLEFFWNSWRISLRSVTFHGKNSC